MEGINGPWRCEGVYDVLDADGGWVAEIHGPREAWWPRARLIAQAPAMAEALEAFVAACETAPPVDLITHIGAACEKAKAVLAAIKGE